MTVWAGGFCGGFSSLGLRFISKALHINALPVSPFIFWGAAAFFGIPLVGYFGKRASYAKAEYRFYHDRLEYYEGFLNMQHRTVPYRNVFEVDLRKGPVQQQYNLGTLILSRRTGR